MNENKQNLGSFTKFCFDAVDCAASAFIIAAILLTFIFIKFDVNGSSMLPTLHDKDKILVYHLLYEPRHGDIITIDSPGFLDENIIKRVIAVAGDSIKVERTTGKVYVNGKSLDETYIYEPGKPFKTFGDEWEIPEIVPENCLFVMGDNRNGSTDSRSKYVKFVNKADVMGRAFVIYNPFNRIKLL